MILDNNFLDASVLKPASNFIDDNKEVSPQAPTPGPDVGVSAILIDLIQDAYNTVKQYNDAISTISSLRASSELIAVLTDIVNKEHIHIGTLKRALESVSPNVRSQDSGELEAEKYFDDNSQSLLKTPHVNENLLEANKFEKSLLQKKLASAETTQTPTDTANSSQKPAVQTSVSKSTQKSTISNNTQVTVGDTDRTVEIVYDTAKHKLRAMADDGINGRKFVQFPSKLRTHSGQKYVVDRLVYVPERAFYRVVGDIIPLTESLFSKKLSNFDIDCDDTDTTLIDIDDFVSELLDCIEVSDDVYQINLKIEPSVLKYFPVEFINSELNKNNWQFQIIAGTDSEIVPCDILRNFKFKPYALDTFITDLGNYVGILFLKTVADTNICAFKVFEKNMLDTILDDEEF